MNIRKTAAVALPVAVAALTLAGCKLNMENNDFSDDQTVSRSISRVNITDTVGDVTVEVGGRTTTVHREVHYGDHKPGATTSAAGHTLDLRSCGDDCSVDYTVRVPANTTVTGSVSSGSVSLTGVKSVNIRSEAGSITVSDVKAGVTATMDSGSVTASGVGGDVTVRTQSGNIDLSGLRGSRTSAQSSSGDISVSTAAAQDVDARTADGSVTLDVAAGSYRVTTSTGDGSAHVTVPNDPNGRHTLRASSDSGNVRVDAN
jgi:hypothetical protein